MCIFIFFNESQSGKLVVIVVFVAQCGRDLLEQSNTTKIDCFNQILHEFKGN